MRKVIDKVIIECEDDSRCRKVMDFLDVCRLENVEAVHVAPLEKILKKFEADENVEWRLIHEDNIAMNRGLLDYPDAPREIIVASEHPAYERYNFSEEEKTKHVLMSILHEEAHLSGITDEEEAENVSVKKYNRCKCVKSCAFLEEG